MCRGIGSRPQKPHPWRFPLARITRSIWRGCKMTTDITTTIRNDVLKGLEEINEITSFEDIERLFLRGVGNSNLIYKVYRNKVKLFYYFTKGLHPILVKPADIGCKWQVNFPYQRKVNFPVLMYGNPTLASYRREVPPGDTMQAQSRKWSHYPLSL